MKNRILKDLFALFTITVPIRYTQNQIDKSVAVIKNYFKSKNIQVDIFKKQKEKRTYTSLLINSPESKEKILIAALDTPSMGIFFKKYDYLDAKKNLSKKRTSLTISILLSTLFISLIIVMTLTLNLTSNFSKAFFVITVGIIAILTSWISSEHTVRHNEPNDCSLALCAKLLENHQDIGLILVDGFYQNVGLSFLLESNVWLKNKHCLFIGEIDTSTHLCIYHNDSPQLTNNVLSKFNNLVFYAMIEPKQNSFEIGQKTIDFEELEKLYILIEKEL